MTDAAVAQVLATIGTAVSWSAAYLGAMLWLGRDTASRFAVGVGFPAVTAFPMWWLLGRIQG